MHFGPCRRVSKAFSHVFYQHFHGSVDLDEAQLVLQLEKWERPTVAELQDDSITSEVTRLRWDLTNSCLCLLVEATL